MPVVQLASRVRQVGLEVRHPGEYQVPDDIVGATRPEYVIFDGGGHELVEEGDYYQVSAGVLCGIFAVGYIDFLADIRSG